MNSLPTFKFEKDLINKGHKRIAGVDEAGRGAFAGPIVGAAVILDININIPGINDSKKISEKKRELLYEEIIINCLAYSVSIYDNTRIDEHGVGKINELVLFESVQKLNIKPSFVLIDGFKIDMQDIPSKQIIKGDQLSLSIASASIIAKVTRDRIMRDYDSKYPLYGFAKHKGYGTKLHRDMIAKFGVCPIHRTSYKGVG